MAAAEAKAAQDARLEKLEAEGGEPEPEPEPETYSVGILRIIKESQAQNGLRHNDYQRYRQYCSRRLHRLRRSLNFKHGKKRYQKKELTAEVVADERFLHIPLICSERCWSYAMQLKEEMVDHPRKKQQMLSKIGKASKYAYELFQLCKERADERSQLEAEAYAAFMFGNVLLEKERWKQAQAAFTKAQNRYSEMARLAPMSDEKDGGAQRLYANMSDELTPSIMYCQYNAKKHGGGDMDEDDTALQELLDGSVETPALELLKSQLSGEAKSDSQSLTQVEFRGAKLNVTNPKLGTAIVTAREELKKVGSEKGLDKKMDRFGRVSVAYNDAVTVVSRDLQEKRGDGGQEEQVAELQNMEIYVNICAEEAEIERNLVLAESYRRRLAINGERQEPGGAEEGGKTTKPDELVAIYDKLINNCSDILELPGVDDSETEKAFYSARLLSFKALRCLYMGEAFRAQSSWPQAFVLYERAAELAGAAKGRHKTKGWGKSDGGAASAQSAARDADVKRIEEAILRIDGLRPLVHASAFLQSHKQEQEGAAPKADATLQEAIGVYARPASLAPFPPGFEPTTCKPILFDLVDRELEFPMEELEAKAKVKGAGMFGAWGGFGWGK